MNITSNEQIERAQSCQSEATHAQEDEIRRLFRNKYTRVATVLADVEHAASETLSAQWRRQRLFRHHLLAEISRKRDLLV